MIDQHPLRTIIARIFSIRCGTGVEYKYDNAWAVINSICCDRGASSLKWHTLYLIAVRTYQPILKTEHVRNVAQWRNEVKLSIENEEAKYVRDTVYDQLLELLFPEMRSALNNPFGTPLQILEKDDDVFETLPYPQPVQFETSGNTFLHGREFEEWARRNPDAAKVWLDSPAGKKHQQQQNGHKSAGSQQYGQWKRKRS
jgi:hypothetical protein